MNSHGNITGVILAGGKNRRFPVIKGLARVGEERIIDRAKRILRGLFNEIIISTNNPEYYFYLGETMVGDVHPSEGPMVGIFSALLNSIYDRIFVIACDMPFIKYDLIQYICSMTTDDPVVLCSYNGRIHPLFGLYSKKILPSLEHHIQKGLIGLQSFISVINSYIIYDDEIKKIDSDGSSFVNINTPEDFKKFIGGKICLD